MLFFRSSFMLKPLFLSFLILVGGCGGTPQPVKEVFLQSVALDIDPHANENTAIALDFVVTYNTELSNTLLQLPAFKYFEQKKQLIRDNPDTLQIWSWEVVPGQFVNIIPIVFSGLYPQTGIFFANYLTPGDHRIRIGKQTAVLVMLGEKDFSLQAITIPSDLNGS